MGRLTDQIREYISSPQVDGNEHYGKWGALRKDQRLLIADLCKYCDLQEKYADTFFKEIQSLKQQLAEKDKEIAELKTELETYRPTKLKGRRHYKCSHCEKELNADFCCKYEGKIFCNKCFRHIITRDDLLRHQICEEIRTAIRIEELKYIWEGDCKDIYEILDRIEQGESK